MLFMKKEFNSPLSNEDICFLLVHQRGELVINTDGDYELFFQDADNDDGLVWSASKYSLADVIAELKSDGWEFEDDNEAEQFEESGDFEQSELDIYFHFPKVDEILYDTFVEKVSQTGINCNFGEHIDSQSPNFDIRYNALKGYVLGRMPGYMPPYVMHGESAPKIPDAERAFISFSLFPTTEDGASLESTTHSKFLMPCLEAEVMSDGNYRIICANENLQRCLLQYLSLPAYRIYGKCLGEGNYYGVSLVEVTKYERLKGKLIPGQCSVIGKKTDGTLLLEYTPTEEIVVTDVNIMDMDFYDVYPYFKRLCSLDGENAI